jgi:NitT/TauT family transport system permease protein
LIDRNDEIPAFGKRPDSSGIGLSNWSALTSGASIRSAAEVIAIALVAIAVIGGAEILLRLFHVPQYILPAPSLIFAALISD